jgi:hypothetical protein
MRRTEEEEEFTMATNRLKSDKSASALCAVSRLNYSNIQEYNSKLFVLNLVNYVLMQIYTIQDNSIFEVVF